MSRGNLVLLTVFVLSIIVILVLKPYHPKNKGVISGPASGEEVGCMDSDGYCADKNDGVTCNYGVWCDEYGNRCGGQSCTGLTLGICKTGKCVDSQKTPEARNLTVPDLPKVNWTVETTKEKLALDGKTLVLNGKVYTYTRSFKTNEERVQDTFSLLPFSIALEELGWRNSIDTGEYALSVGHSDGPLSSQSGVVAYKGSVIKVVIERAYSSVQSGSYPDVICPCQKTDEVFISDETDLNDESVFQK